MSHNIRVVTGTPKPPVGVNVATQRSTTVVLPSAARGIPGPEGPAGPPGAAYRHLQDAEQDIWVIDHELGYYPAVTVTDSAGNEVVASLTFPTKDTVVVSFSAPFSGTAHLS